MNNIIKRCRSCLFRHCCHRDLPPSDKDCKHWKLGKCYTCKYIESNEAEWFTRGCETWCFGGCEKYKRDWQKTLRWLKQKMAITLAHYKEN